MQHAVITGGGSGIGLAIAESLYEKGYELSLIGRDMEKLVAARKQMPKVRIAQCDITDDMQVSQAFNALPPVSILINNAGAVETAAFQKFSKEQWQDALDVNLLGAVSCINACLDQIKTDASGRIINIASTASLKGYAYVAPYVAAKHALLGMTRALALELAKTPVTVNAICPGYSKTAIIDRAVDEIAAKTGRGKDKALAHFEKNNPQGRLIDPDEIASTVLWLISDATRSITGQAIVIAGGEIM
ncbi:MAG: SDR family oxidoreductase [Sphingomonadales bacterium]|jgi:NAD(P)-dependent dehydrogenase (short-subunit alcohol dehydrogenase family)